MKSVSHLLPVSYKFNRLFSVYIQIEPVNFMVCCCSARGPATYQRGKEKKSMKLPAEGLQQKAHLQIRWAFNIVT
jgi:hypothetical protein